MFGVLVHVPGCSEAGGQNSVLVVQRLAGVGHVFFFA